MRRYIKLVVAFMLISNQAYAKPLIYSCQRFMSDCVGAACEIARDELQKKPGYFPPGKITERLSYTITDTPGGAMRAFEEQAGTKRYYTQLTASIEKFTLSMLNSQGHNTERVEIDRHSGFYSYYKYAVDDSHTGIKPGEPYAAWLGWCTPG